jgi:hypothetical protein
MNDWKHVIKHPVIPTLLLFFGTVIMILTVQPVSLLAADCVLESGYTATTDPGTTIAMEDGSTFTVNTGATLNLIGSTGNLIAVTHDVSGDYSITVNGTIAAGYTIFDYLDTGGITVSSTGAIDTVNNFSNCTFQNGTSGGAMLTVNNAQDFRTGGLGTIDNTYWGTGATYNAAKSQNQGYLQFLNFSGPLSGEDHDSDPHDRIIWGQPTPTHTPSPTRTPTFTPTAAPSAPTNTPVPTSVPTDTPTRTPTVVPPTNTPVPPTNTPLPPTPTVPTGAPTNTPIPPTNTPIPPTNTPIPPTDTPVMPTDTPVIPTDTPVPPTNTPECTVLGCEVYMPSDDFVEGDDCYCDVYVCNPGDDTYPDVPVFVILDVYGLYFFAPSFSDFDFYTKTIEPGEMTISVLPSFPWPGGVGTASGILWYAAMTDQNMTQLFGELGMFTFGWH